MRNITIDVLVIGGGAAGIRAALSAAESGAAVLLLSKGDVAESGSTFSPVSKGWGIQALMGEERTERALEAFYEEILEVGLGLCDPEMARVLVEDSGSCLEDLVRYGFQFRRNAEGTVMREPGCFSSARRAYLTESYGNMQQTFQSMLHASGARVLSGTATDLLVHDDACLGARVLLGTGEMIRLGAGATVLATGGGGHIYRDNLVTPDATGDGYALAYRAGARLDLMAFVQFMLGVRRAEGFGFFPRFQLTREGALLDASGRDLLDTVFGDAEARNRAVRDRRRHAPFSCRDESFRIDAGIAFEISSGRKVFWDDGGSRREVMPCAHAFNGGVKTDVDGRASLAGLYAAGESATGAHGADRIGGCMMTATQVFGRRAGVAAARYAKRSNPEGFRERVGEEPRVRLSPGGKSNVGPCLDEIGTNLKRAMSTHCTVRRTGVDLVRCLQVLEDCEAGRAAAFPAGTTKTAQYYTLRNMILVAGNVTKAALVREESLGSHYREDFPPVGEGRHSDDV